MTVVTPEGYVYSGRKIRNMTAFDRYKRSMPRETIRVSSSMVHPSLIGAQQSVKPSVPNLAMKEARSSKKRTGANHLSRSVAVGLLVIVSLCAVILPASKAFGRRSLVSSERPNAKEITNVQSIVVAQGDTLWSIAEKLEPNKDPRKIVDQLIKARGTSDLFVGETIEWTH